MFRTYVHYGVEWYSRVKEGAWKQTTKSQQRVQTSEDPAIPGLSLTSTHWRICLIAQECFMSQSKRDISNNSFCSFVPHTQ